MSGESTDPQDPDDTSSVKPVAPAPPAPPVGTAESIVPAFDVPAPELVDVPDAETAAADFAVPPPPKFETPSVPPAPRESAVPPPSDATWSSERTWKPRLTWKHGEDSEAAEPAKPETVQEKLDRVAPAAASSRAALRDAAAASDADRPTVVPPSVPEDTGNRGWTITIFTGLAVLFIGAIGLMVFLGLSG